MELKLVQQESEWSELAGAWNALLGRSTPSVPFLRHEFLQAWWETLGGGEWAEGRLWVVVAFRNDGGLRAAAPLFWIPGDPSLRILGTQEIADYLDVLSEPEARDPFVEALLDLVRRHPPAGVRSLDLWNLQEDSPSLPAFERAAALAGWRATRETLKPCPRASLDGGWTAYLSRLEKKQRHELRRKMRRAEAVEGGARVLRAGRDLDPEPAIETFLELMAHDPEKKGFLTTPMRKTFRDMTRRASAQGWLRLEILEIAGEPAAGVLAFDFDRRLWLYNSGLDPRQEGLSPGWVLLGNMIRDAADEGKLDFDFLRGGEAYKFRLGGVARSLHRLQLTPD